MYHQLFGLKQCMQLLGMWVVRNRIYLQFILTDKRCGEIHASCDNCWEVSTKPPSLLNLTYIEKKISAFTIRFSYTGLLHCFFYTRPSEPWFLKLHYRCHQYCSYMYAVACLLSPDSQSHFRHMCRVYSYNYKQLTLQYDPDKQSLVRLLL